MDSERKQSTSAGTEERQAPRITTGDDIETVKALHSAYEKMTDQISRVIVGQDEVIEQVLVAIFCRGHGLLVGVPGLAKTLLVSTISRVVHLRFKRIQFTPDFMPSDITGTDVLEEDRTTGKRIFRFIHGPLFANMILADEINRTPPKTQAALLEAMQERIVTVGEQDYKLPDPTLPRSPGHYEEWIRACKGGEKAMSNFDYASALTETALLGNLAVLVGEPIYWDPERMRAINCPKADCFINTPYRRGWSL